MRWRLVVPRMESASSPGRRAQESFAGAGGFMGWLGSGAPRLAGPEVFSGAPSAHPGLTMLVGVGRR
jgi:hypothetical protein